MRRILLLESDSLLAETIKRFFEAAGYQLSVHSDPQAAVLAADKHQPDLVITEIQLAARSGIEFLYEFRSYPDWQTIPVLILTNLSSADLRGYRQVFNELNISRRFYKPTTSLPQLLQAAQHIYEAA